MTTTINETIQEAQAAIENKDFEKGRALLTQALQDSPNDQVINKYALYYLSFISDSYEACFDYGQKFLAEIEAAEHLREREVVEERLTKITPKLIEYARDLPDKEKAKEILQKIVASGRSNGAAAQALSALKPSAPKAEPKKAKSSKKTPRPVAPPLQKKRVSEKSEKPAKPQKNKGAKGINLLQDLKKTPEKSEVPHNDSWTTFFKSAEQLTKTFNGYVDELIQICEEESAVSQKKTKSLQYAKEMREQWEPELPSKIFLAPAVRTAVDIIKLLFKDNKFKEAFYFSNVFAEMGKALVSQNQERYQKTFRQLVKFAARSYVGERLNENAANNSVFLSVSLSNLAQDLRTNCMDGALGVYFDNEGQEFKANPEPDQDLAAAIMSDALQWGTDCFLQRLLDEAPEEVENFIRDNLGELKRFADVEAWAQKWLRSVKDESVTAALQELIPSDDKREPKPKTNVRAELKQAAENRDFDAAAALLEDEVDLVVKNLQQRSKERFVYKRPQQPRFRDFNLYKAFETLTQNLDFDLAGRAEYTAAIEKAKDIWLAEIENLDIQEWIAYFYIRVDGLVAAERMLELLKNRRKNTRKKLFAYWNLAVIQFRKGDLKGAYKNLHSLLLSGASSEELSSVLLSMAHKLKKRNDFLKIVQRSLNDELLPLSFKIAHDYGDSLLQEHFLNRILKNPGWQLPDYRETLNDISLKKTVNKAVIEGHVDQLVTWLKDRIKLSPGYVPNYNELSRVLEYHCMDIEGAYYTLRVVAQKTSDADGERTRAKQRMVDSVCRELLNFCRRNERPDLGKRAYKLVRSANVSPDLLRPFEDYASASDVRMSDTAEIHAITKTEDGKCGIFIDHENLVKCLHRVNTDRGYSYPKYQDKTQWLSEIIRSLIDETERRIKRPAYRVAVAFWRRKTEADYGVAYSMHDFVLRQPEDIKQGNAVDFKVADEVRRAQLHALSEKTKLTDVIIVSGDGDFAHMARNLVHEGVNVQIWGGSKDTSQHYADIVGAGNIISIDDVCGL